MRTRAALAATAKLLGVAPAAARPRGRGADPHALLAEIAREEAWYARERELFERATAAEKQFRKSDSAAAKAYHDQRRAHGARAVAIGRAIKGLRRRLADATTATGASVWSERAALRAVERRAYGGFLAGDVAPVTAEAHAQIPRRARPATPPKAPGFAALWKLLGKNAPHACASPYVGRFVPGRDAGTITQCATPPHAFPAPGEMLSPKQRAGQFWVEGPAGAHAIRKSTARNRIAAAGQSPCDQRRDPLFSAVELEEFQRARAEDQAAAVYVPRPTELAYPHAKAKGRCCAYHALWADLAAKVTARRAAGDDPEELANSLRYDPQWAAWVATEDACVAQWSARVAERKGAAGYSTAREAARRRAQLLEEGVDVTSAEYLDTLRASEVARHNRYDRGGGKRAGRRSKR